VKNWFTTAGGILAAFALLPDMWGSAIQNGTIHAVMPGWFYILCVFLGKVGPVLIGVGAADALRGRNDSAKSTDA
jgi:hypothetical protein